MLRIVKMIFREQEINTFQLHFEKVGDQILQMDGCNGLSLLQDRRDKRIFFTYSKWDGPEALEAYRQSELFKQTWSKVKPLFAEKAEAWSVDQNWQKGTLT